MRVRFVTIYTAIHPNSNNTFTGDCPVWAKAKNFPPGTVITAKRTMVLSSTPMHHGHIHPCSEKH